jgi:hypothetical protein
MPTMNIIGQMQGAYRDEPTFLLEGETEPKGLLYILQMMLGGEATADGNGIYSGSGNVPAGAIATTQGSFKIRSEGNEILFGDDQGAFQSFLNKMANGTWGFRVGDSADGLECDLQVYKTGLFVETDSASAPGVTTIITNKDQIELRANNESGNIVFVRITPKSVTLTGIPNYADDAAADADAALLTKSLYTTTGARTIKIKP